MLTDADGCWCWWALTDAEVDGRWWWQTLMLTDAEGPWCWQTLVDADADNDRRWWCHTTLMDTCTDSLPQFIWCWLKVKLWPGHMCTKFQINRSTIDDFRNSEKSQLSLTSLYEKTWLRTSTGVRYFRSGFRQRTFCNQLEVSTTSDSKVMAHYVFFMFGVILTLTFDLSRSLFMCGVNIDPLVSTKKILNIFCGWVFVIWLFIKKAMYRPCDLDLWPMKVNYFLWIDYQPIHVLYKFEIDISTNSREIKYLNIEIWV